MQKIRSFTFVILFGIAAVGLTVAPARAAVLLIDGGGQLTGATGVEVLGSFYDVTFADGSCMAVFSGCNEPADFAFNDAAGGLAAAQALLSQVFIDLDSSNQFDSEPARTVGCVGGINGCFAFIPYEYQPANNNGFFGGRAFNSFAEVDDAAITGAGPTPITDDFVTNDSLNRLTFAVFTPVAVVPLPPAILLFGSGLVTLFGYAGIGRRRQRRA